MTQAEITEQVPIVQWKDGSLRIGSSRVLLELVIEAFQDGATPEAIVQAYPTVSLADAYRVIGYYLHQPDSINRYLEQRQLQGDQSEAELRADPEFKKIRERLLRSRR